MPVALSLSTDGGARKCAQRFSSMPWAVNIRSNVTRYTLLCRLPLQVVLTSRSGKPAGFVESAFRVSANLAIKSRYALVSSSCCSRSFPCCTCLLFFAPFPLLVKLQFPLDSICRQLLEQPLYLFHCTAGCCRYPNDRWLALYISVSPTRSQSHATSNRADLQLLDN